MYDIKIIRKKLFENHEFKIIDFQKSSNNISYAIPFDSICYTFTNLLKKQITDRYENKPEYTGYTKNNFDNYKKYYLVYNYKKQYSDTKISIFYRTSENEIKEVIDKNQKYRLSLVINNELRITGIFITIEDNCLSFDKKNEYIIANTKVDLLEHIIQNGDIKSKEDFKNSLKKIKQSYEKRYMLLSNSIDFSRLSEWNKIFTGIDNNIISIGDNSDKVITNELQAKDFLNYGMISILMFILLEQQMNAEIEILKIETLQKLQNKYEIKWYFLPVNSIENISNLSFQYKIIKKYVENSILYVMENLTNSKNLLERAKQKKTKEKNDTIEEDNIKYDSTQEIYNIDLETTMSNNDSNIKFRKLECKIEALFPDNKNDIFLDSKNQNNIKQNLQHKKKIILFVLNIEDTFLILYKLQPIFQEVEKKVKRKLKILSFIDYINIDKYLDGINISAQQYTYENSQELIKNVDFQYIYNISESDEIKLCPEKIYNDFKQQEEKAINNKDEINLHTETNNIKVNNLYNEIQAATNLKNLRKNKIHEYIMISMKNAINKKVTTVFNKLQESEILIITDNTPEFFIDLFVCGNNDKLIPIISQSSIISPYNLSMTKFYLILKKYLINEIFYIDI